MLGGSLLIVHVVSVFLLSNMLFCKKLLTQLFADEDIEFAGQQVGMIVARTQELADQAADLVKIFYKDAKKPVLDVREVAKNNDTSRIFLRSDIPAVLPKRKINIEGQICTLSVLCFYIQ